MTKAKQGHVLQLKVTLEGITPKIWRRFLVEDTMTFHRLHQAIQRVMGWSDSHLYEFYIGDKNVGLPREPGDHPLLDSKKEKIAPLRQKQKFGYTYDFGDCWEHVLVVEKILPKTPSVSYPVCLAGERNCPPEDCGSVSGYDDLIAIRKNKKHPQYGSLIKNWLGEDYNPECFNVQEVNAELRRTFRTKGGKTPGGRAG